MQKPQRCSRQLLGLAILATILFAAGCSSNRIRRPADADIYGLEFYNISDAHVVDQGDQNTWRLTKDSAEILKSTIEKVEDEHPDLVLFSGDLVEGKGYGLRNLDLASKVVSKLSMPWLVVPGNHEQRFDPRKKYGTRDAYDLNAFVEKFKGHGPRGAMAYWRYDVPRKKITFLGLDTSKPGTPGGAVPESQRRWLEETLENLDQDRIAIIVMHHPAVVFNEVVSTDRKLKTFVLDNHQAMRATFEKYPQVKLVISGHTHTPEHSEINGIHYVGCPSINTWPNRYTRFTVTRTQLQFSHLPIRDSDKIDEAYQGLLRDDSVWLGLLKSEHAIRNYFSHGPLEKTVAIPVKASRQ